MEDFPNPFTRRLHPFIKGSSTPRVGEGVFKVLYLSV